jgi:hypothetical protein
MSRRRGGGEGVRRRKPDTPTTQDAPLGAARLVSDSRLSYNEQFLLRQQHLELQLELERQRTAYLQQQQARPPVPPPPSSLSKTQWIGPPIPVSGASHGGRSVRHGVLQPWRRHCHHRYQQ